MPTRWIATRRSSRADWVSGMWRASVRFVIAARRIASIAGPALGEGRTRRSNASNSSDRQGRPRAAEPLADRRLDAGGVEAAERQQLRRLAVLDEAVGQPELQHRGRDAGRG